MTSNEEVLGLPMHHWGNLDWKQDIGAGKWWSARENDSVRTQNKDYKMNCVPGPKFLFGAATTDADRFEEVKDEDWVLSASCRGQVVFIEPVRRNHKWRVSVSDKSKTFNTFLEALQHTEEQRDRILKSP